METETPTAPDWRAMFVAACENLPETVTLPYAMTEEGQRWAKFKTICPPEFLEKIDRTKLVNPTAFDRVANWNGTYPGPCAFGKTSTAKSRAAWWALRQHYVKNNKAFAWFPVRRMITELEKYEQQGNADRFFSNYAAFPVLLVDDADKINWQFASHAELLFAFYDWVYRQNIPCITTTNKDRAWWAKKMGDAFARRMFDDAHFPVEF